MDFDLPSDFALTPSSLSTNASFVSIAPSNATENESPASSLPPWSNTEPEYQIVPFDYSQTIGQRRRRPISETPSPPRIRRRPITAAPSPDRFVHFNARALLPSQGSVPPLSQVAPASYNTGDLAELQTPISIPEPPLINREPMSSTIFMGSQPSSSYGSSRSSRSRASSAISRYWRRYRRRKYRRRRYRKRRRGISKYYPHKNYMYQAIPVDRTNPARESLTKYGKNWFDADTQQRVNRITDRVYGGGLYTGNIRGRGGFFGRLWNNRSRIMDGMQTAANALGYGAIANPARQLARAVGFGPYDVNSNVLVNKGASTNFQAPTFTEPTDDGACVFSHREYICNIYAPDTSGFSIQSFDLNPGLEASFAWLAQIASNFQEYMFGQLIFSYKSTVSEFTTTTGVTGVSSTLKNFIP